MRARNIVHITLAAAVLACFVSCRKEPAKATKVTVSENRLSLKVGESATLKAVVEPASCESPVNWSSSNRNVARCNQGVVEALSAGKATITAGVDQVSGECSVSVYSGDFTISGKQHLIDSNALAYRSGIDHELGEIWSFTFNSSEGAEYGYNLRIDFPLNLLGIEIDLNQTYEGDGFYPYWSISHWMNQNENFRAVFYDFGTEFPVVYDGELFEDRGVTVTSGKMKISKTGYGAYTATLECSFSDGETISLEWEGLADFN